MFLTFSLGACKETPVELNEGENINKLFSVRTEDGGSGLALQQPSSVMMYMAHIDGEWTRAESDAVPEIGKYYHAVGVYDKENENVHIYVNGELRGTNSNRNAIGEYKFPVAKNNWYAIGGDPGPQNTQLAWNGDIVIAKMYSNPLTAGQIETLWDEYKDINATSDMNDNQMEAYFLSGIEVGGGSAYNIAGSDFKSGDKVKFEKVGAPAQSFLCDGTVTQRSIKVTVLSEFQTGEYKMTLVRGSEPSSLGTTKLTVVSGSPQVPMPRIIAHRGYHEAAYPENSVKSLAKAQELGVYGSEFDIWMTKDKELVVHHDPVIKGVTIRTANYADIKDLIIGNGIKLPKASQFFEQGKKASTVLRVEIKEHGDKTLNYEVTDKVLAMVSAAGLDNQVEYTSSSMDVCDRIIEKVPTAIIACLGANKSIQGINNKRIKCASYNQNFIKNNPSRVQEVHALDMTINVYDVNTIPDMLQMIAVGVDYISTDNPIVLINLMTALTE